MLIPSIDLSGGQTVQWVGGKESALDLGDPRPHAARFARTGPVAIVDLDAALGTGSHAELIRDGILPLVPDARVGGGIRDEATARTWLDAGVAQIIIGSAASPEFCASFPPERVIAAVDSRDGEVMVGGWREGTGKDLFDEVRALAPHVGGFLLTFIEREGRLGGTDLERAERLVQAAGRARVCVAGGVTTAEEVAALDRVGADAQVGMALYKGLFTPADALAAILEDQAGPGPWPSIVSDELGQALGLVWSDRESLAVALERGVGAYHSRRRGLWVKGETSGATQALVDVLPDCDRDALRFRVRQKGTGFCHEETRTCFGEIGGVAGLVRALESRLEAAPEGSYTRRLLDDPQLLRAKLIEEAGELADAGDRDHVAAEAADLLYFAAVAMVRSGVTLEDVDHVLDRRARKLTRRPGDAKPGAIDTESSS